MARLQNGNEVGSEKSVDLISSLFVQIWKKRVYAYFHYCKLSQTYDHVSTESVGKQFPAIEKCALREVCFKLMNPTSPAREENCSLLCPEIGKARIS